MDNNGNSGWPTVRKDDWCGRHEDGAIARSSAQLYATFAKGQKPIPPTVT